MANNKCRAICLLLILMVLSLALIACGDGTSNGGNGSLQESQTNHPGSIADATATFGAREFHIQLTAIAQQEVTPAAP